MNPPLNILHLALCVGTIKLFDKIATHCLIKNILPLLFFLRNAAVTVVPIKYTRLIIIILHNKIFLQIKFKEEKND